MAGLRYLPQFERNGQRIDADADPPRGLVPVTVQFAVMEPADGDRVLVADLSPEGSGLGEAEMMRFGRAASAYNARLPSNELAVLLVAQANRLGGDATAACTRLGEPWTNGGVLHWRKEGLVCSQSHFASRRFKTIDWHIGSLHPS